MLLKSDNVIVVHQNIQIEQHAQDAIALSAEGYANNTGGTGIGVFGKASVGISNQATLLRSIVAGSPETDQNSTVVTAIGLEIEDVTVATTNYALKTGLGSIQFGGANPGALFKFEPIGLPTPDAEQFTVGLTGSGSTTYTYVVTQVTDDGIRESAPSATITVPNGPDTLDNVSNYVTITFPSDGKFYNLYRTGGGPVGYLTQGFGNSYNDTNLFAPSGSSAPGPLPFANGRDTGIMVSATAPTRALYNISEGGLIIGAVAGYPTELRLSNLDHGWQDNTVGVSLLQITNTLNNNAAIMGGTVNSFTQFDRLSIHSQGTVFTNATHQSTPAPDGMVEFYAGSDIIPFVVRSNGSSQTADLSRWLAPNQSVIAKVTANGAVVANVISGGFQQIAPGQTAEVDLSTGNVFYHVMADGDVALTFVNGYVGQQGTLIFQQEVTGGHLLNWPVNTLNPLPVDPTGTSYTLFTFVWDGSRPIVLSSSKEGNIVKHVATNATPEFDCRTGDIFTYDQTANAAPTFTNLKIGQRVTFIIAIDGNGPYTWTWPGNVFGGFDISSEVGTSLIQEFLSPDGTNLYPMTDGRLV